MDGEVEFILHRLAPDEEPPDSTQGSVQPATIRLGPRMGRIVARRGHLTLLPADSAYRFSAATPSVLLMQTIEGEGTQYRWAEICQTPLTVASRRIN